MLQSVEVTVFQKRSRKPKGRFFRTSQLTFGILSRFVVLLFSLTLYSVLAQTVGEFGWLLITISFFIGEVQIRRHLSANRGTSTTLHLKPNGLEVMVGRRLQLYDWDMIKVIGHHSAPEFKSFLMSDGTYLELFERSFSSNDSYNEFYDKVRESIDAVDQEKYGISA